MNTLLYFSVIAIAVSAALFLLRDKPLRKLTVVGAALILFLEIFVFNYGTYGIFFGDYARNEIDLYGGGVAVAGREDAPFSGNAEQDVTVELTGLSQSVYDLSLAVELQPATEYDSGASAVDVSVDAMDETQSGFYRYAVAEGKIVRGDVRSAFLRLNLSGKVSALRLSFGTNAGEFTVRGITLNAPVPPRFSLLRSGVLFFCLFLFGLFVFLAQKGGVYGKKPLVFRSLVYIAALVFVLGSCAVMLTSYYDNNGSLPDFGGGGYGNQITEELVDAFEKGQVSLLDMPEEALLRLENPYDWSQRINAEAEGKWDHLLFNGKYYSYYGIAPVLLLFLPFHLLTGLYFSTPLAVLLFGGVGILFLSLFFVKFCDLWCARIPNLLLFSAYLILLSSSGIFYCFAYPNFYEIAQSSGFMFTAAGFYFLLCSNVARVPEEAVFALPERNEKRSARPIRPGFTAAASACFSLAVLCRPTLALYCVTALIFYASAFFRQLRAADTGAETKKTRIRRLVPFLLCALLPFAVIGGVQMAYNYVRFGSFTDFGIQYSLTINDFTRSQFHLDFVAIGFYNFLFAFPHFLPRFPYVASDFSDLDLNGYYFIANRNAVGLFWKALPAWGIFGLPFVRKSLTKEERKRVCLLVLPVSVLAPFVIIFSIWESGYGVRYGADFNWQILLCGILVCFVLYRRLAGAQLKRLFHVFFGTAAALSLWINSALIYEYMELSGFLSAPALSFARLFDFWI